jgi:hypothetical protein
VYPWLKGLLIYYTEAVLFVITFAKLYPIRTPLSLQPYSCCDVEVLALTDGGVTLALEVAVYYVISAEVT